MVTDSRRSEAGWGSHSSTEDVADDPLMIAQ